MELKFVNVHEHNIHIATSKMTEYKKCFRLSEYKELKPKEEMVISLINTYYNVKCRICDKIFIKSNESQKFIVSKDNIEGLINSFDDKQKLEGVSFENRPGINELSNKDFYPEEFYVIKYAPRFDDKMIYIGTEEEKKNYFHKSYLELKEKLELIELNKFNGGIMFKEQLDEEKGKYDIVVDINSILSLQDKGWNINYPLGKEDYEKKVKKESIIMGVLGNRNKGKSFILAKLSGYQIKQGFSIKTEGISVKFSKTDEDDNKFLIILDSAGQEVPLLKVENFENNQKKELFQNNEIKEKNEIEENNEIKEKNEIEENNEIKEKNEIEENNEIKEIKEIEEKKEIKDNNEIEEKKEIKDNNEIKIIKEKNEIEENKEIKQKKENNKIEENKEEKNKINNNQDNKNAQINADEDFNKNSELEKLLRDKLITEKFIEDFIILNSNVLVLVVGSITLNEQKLMKRIKQSLKDNQELFVIHNLQNFYEKTQVNDYIDNTLKKLFGLQIHENKFYDTENLYDRYFVEIDKEGTQVTHLIFVNDYSPIGDFYNKPTCKYLNSKLRGVGKRTCFSVVEKIKKFFIERQNKFLLDPIKQENFIEEENKLSIKEQKISFKKVFIDEIGETIINDTDKPNYNYYTEKRDLIVNVELPGPKPEIKTKCELQGGFYVFIFKGKTADFTSVIQEKCLLSKNVKKSKDFQFIFRISTDDITLLPNEKGNYNYYSRTMEDKEGKGVVGGIFTFKYHIKDKSSTDDFE